MKPRLGFGKSGLLALAALALSIFSITGSATFAANQTLSDSAQATADGSWGDDQQSIHPPATFFTINAVLAKLDRDRGRGPGAVRMAALSPSATVTDGEPEYGSSTPVDGNEPFGLSLFRSPDGVLWRKWREVEADIGRDRLVLEGCREHAESCPPHAAQFLRLVGAVKSKSGRAQLEEANRGINTAIRYVSDLAQFGELDHWSSPLASFATARGDCEDYAIAKYIALRESGFPGDDLRLVLGRDRILRQDHALLAARLDGHWLILDSRRSEVMDDSETANFTPMFAINREGVYLLAAPYAKLQPPELAAPAAAMERGQNGAADIGDESGAPVSARPLLL